MTATIRRIALGGAAAVLALGVSAGLYASAQNINQDPPPFRSGGRGGPGGPGRWGGPGGPMGMLPMFGREIGLTDTQRDQIKAIADSHKDEWQAIGDRARKAHEALNEAVTAETVNDALIRQKSAEVAAIDADMAVARAHAHAEVFQILTADQKAQIKKRQAEMKDRMKNRQQGRRGGLLDHFGL
jgi:periplasmic protein CpxP/Spy